VFKYPLPPSLIANSFRFYRVTVSALELKKKKKKMGRRISFRPSGTRRDQGESGLGETSRVPDVSFSVVSKRFSVRTNSFFKARIPRTYRRSSNNVDFRDCAEFVK